MAERNTPLKDGELISCAVAASAKIEAGNLCALNAAGYLVPAADTANLTVVGVADQTVDNSAGADGALSCLVRRRKAFLFENAGTNPVTQAKVGKSVMVSDSVTVSADTTNDIPAGKCLGVSTEGVWVEVA